MKQHRYMVLEHAEADQQLGIDGNGKITGRIPVHHLLQSYHWHRLDGRHVLVYGSHSISHAQLLQQLPIVSLLPHLQSTKKMKDIMQPAHFAAVQAYFGLADDAIPADLADGVVTRFSPLMHPQR
jgi:hypothetical protein